MKMKKCKRMVDFIAEHNRYIRTGGLAADHPDGIIEPGDYPLSMAEKRFWEREERLYQKMIDEDNGIDKD